MRNVPYFVGMEASAARFTATSPCSRRQRMMSLLAAMCRSCSAANFSRSAMRAMVPSSFMISQMTAASLRPAMRHRSTLPSVCPARVSTPPFFARRGNTQPGETRSEGFAPSATATRTVWARPAAEMAGNSLLAASMDTVKFVPNLEPLRRVMSGRFSASARSAERERQMSPLPSRDMKLMISGVTNSAAATRSPSFSRSSSSTRMIILPFLRSSRAVSTLQRGIRCPQRPKPLRRRKSMVTRSSGALPPGA